MAIDELVNRLDSPTTRRTIVKTGAKIAYAAPIVAATMKLTAAGVAAESCTIDSCNGADQVCGDNPNCYCTLTTDGNIVCGQFTGGLCDTYKPCTSASDCAAGQVCAPGPDCCGGICLSLCAGTVSPGARGQAEGPAGVPPFA